MTPYIVRDDPGHAVHEELADQPEIVRRLLAHRGITNREEAERFLNPDYTAHVHDPFLLKDMKPAVDRIIAAIDANERIVIYSDYDADGIPGAVVLSDFFAFIGFENFEVYIPHRHDEGFGMHLEAVDRFADDNVGLIITIDCGIADVNAARQAREHGIDLIITDHHEAPEERPEALAIVDPKQPDCNYPEEVLCGSGVIFKVIQGVLAKRDFDLPAGAEKWLLDMVGLATLADMVPLTGENRVFAHYGLVVLRRSRRPGLKRLLGRLRINQRFMDEDDIGFMIAPRINAASRMGVPMDAYTFLATRDELEAGTACDHLHEINEQRKGVVASVVKEIRSRLKERDTGMPVVVAGSPEWKPSLLGLAANSIAKEYDKPVFLWGRDGNEVLKGSCRSDGRTNLVELMSAAADAFISYGGHTMAGGFSVDHDMIHTLEERLASAYETLTHDDVEQEVPVDARMTLEDVTRETYEYIARLAPFGIGNPKPVFYFENIEIEAMRLFGRKKDHLELIFRSSSGERVKAVGFFLAPGDFSVTVAQGERINLVAHIEHSIFNGTDEIRLRIVDVV